MRNEGESRNAEVGMRNEDVKYPWESPLADLAEARRLIETCGYHRRDEELADAEQAICGTTSPAPSAPQESRRDDRK
jgi:hypothetical protein